MTADGKKWMDLMDRMDTEKKELDSSSFLVHFVKFVHCVHSLPAPETVLPGSHPAEKHLF